MSLKPWGPGWGKGRRGDRGLLHSRLSRPAPSARGGGGGVGGSPGTTEQQSLALGHQPGRETGA